MNFKTKTFPPVKNNLEHQIIASTTKENNKISENSKNIVKKKKRECLLWNDQYTIKNISYPEEIKPTEKLKKKYKIHLQYTDQNGAKHNKTIRFGKQGKDDYLDHKNIEQKNKLTAKLCNTHNVFHPNYWRLNLLNSGEDLKSNWMSLLNKINN